MKLILDKESCSGGVVRLLAMGATLLLGLLIEPPRCIGADFWGASIGITSDYIVRGISRSNGEPALQLDVHYLNSSGFVAGAFASNTQFDPNDRRDVELDGFLGFAWTLANKWHGKILASHYTYPLNQSGSGYDYDEFSLDVAYQDWLNAAVTFSPNAPRHVGAGTLIGAISRTAEINVLRQVSDKLSATAGGGYYSIDGPDTRGYAYWSAGGAYTEAPLAISVVYVNTSAQAKALFYNGAASGRWVATVIWRF